MPTDLYQPAPFEVRLRSTLAALGIIPLAFAPGVLGAALVSGALLFVDPPIALTDAEISAASAVLQFSGFIVAVAAFVRLYDEGDLIEWRRPTAADLVWIAAGFLALVAAAWVVGAITALLDIETAENAVVTRGQENPTLFLYMIPITILLVGPGEELVFRGVVQGQLKRAFGAVPAIVLASLLFGVVHVLALTGQSGQLAYVLIAAALGLVLGSVYERTGNIVVPAVIHGAWNSLIFAGQYANAVYGTALPV